MRIPTNKLILEAMAARSGTALVAREVKHILRETYGRGASAKSVSKSLLVLEDEHPMVNRRETTSREKGLFNCRYLYLYGFFNPDTGEVA